MKILGIIVALLMPFTLVACDSVDPLVTDECTDSTSTSLTAHATVNKLEAGSLVRRGFFFMEGTEGEPAFNVTPLVNPSFEEGNGVPTGWTSAQESVRSTEQVKVGSYSIKVTGRDSDGQHWTYQFLDDMSHLEGEYVTFGVWLWCNTPDRLCLGLRAYEGSEQLGASFSSQHPGDGQWHWISVTRQMDAGVDRIRVDVHIAAGTVISGYADGAVLASNAVFEDGAFGTGEYSLVITGLEPDTSYRVRAFVANVAGVSYGNTVTCQTLP